MRKPLLAILLIVVVFVGITYGTYASQYHGNYNVTVNFVAYADMYSRIGDQTSITDVVVTSEPTDVMQFWKEFKGVGVASTEYTAYAELNHSDGSTTNFVDFALVIKTEISLSITIDNIAPGQATVRLYVVNHYAETIIFDHTYSTIVG